MCLEKVVWQIIGWVRWIVEYRVVHANKMFKDVMVILLTWCYPFLAVLTVAICVWLMHHLPTAEALSIAITGSLMVSPYVCWYDSSLLALAIIVLWARSGSIVRLLCVLTVVAIPLWLYGGGFKGPSGYMHIGVEVAILLHYVTAVGADGLRRDVSRLRTSLPVTALIGRF